MTAELKTLMHRPNTYRTQRELERIINLKKSFNLPKSEMDSLVSIEKRIKQKELENDTNNN